MRLKVFFGMLLTFALAGCRTPTRMATKVTEVPRVDLALEGGNRGYLVGAPPSAPELKTTRQMVETTIEIPSLYKPKQTSLPVRLDAMAPETEVQLPSSGEAAGPQVFDAYVVKKGDSLWSIAKKHEIYGKASGWRRIFDANRDQLKSPDSVRPGMTLKIPRSAGGGASQADEDEGMTFKK